MLGRSQGDQGSFLCYWHIVRFCFVLSGLFFFFKVLRKFASPFVKLEFCVNLVELFKDAGRTDLVVQTCILSCRPPTFSQYFLHSFS